MTDVCSLVVVGAGSSKSRCGLRHAPSGGPGENSSCLSQLLVAPGVLGVWLRPFNLFSVFIWPSLSLCLFLSLRGTPVTGLKDPPNPILTFVTLQRPHFRTGPLAELPGSGREPARCVSGHPAGHVTVLTLLLHVLGGRGPGLPPRKPGPTCQMPQPSWDPVSAPHFLSCGIFQIATGATSAQRQRS